MSGLKNDRELIALIKRLVFVDDPELGDGHPKAAENRFEMIAYFIDVYGDTDQDTVLFAPEAFVVIRTILHGKRPVDLEYLTDFEGETPEAQERHRKASALERLETVIHEQKTK